MRLPGLCFVLASCLLLSLPSGAQGSKESHGLSLFGELKYPADFPHLAYADPRAPKGGHMRLSAIGTYDTLNPFVLKGTAAAGIALVYETLLEGVQDEPSAQYGLLAERVAVPADLSSATFTLRAAARWHDGRPVTAEDVAFSFELLKEKGRPLYRHYYANVERAEVLDARTVRFHFSGPTNRELPLIVGELSVLPRHYWQGKDFQATSLEPPLGSGPYRVAAVEGGRSIAYERVPDYWGQELPLNRGRNNFDRIRYDYYRDPTIALEAFKAGEFDFRAENSAKNWATAYDFPALQQGLVRKLELANENPHGMQAFVLNQRRPMFQDRRVRQALGHTFDFEWSNKTLFFGQYRRSLSYFGSPGLSAVGLPDAEELKFLAPLKGKLPEEVFDKPFALPVTDGSGELRDGLRAARKLLEEAGWTVREQRLVNRADGKPMEIEVLIVDPNMERVVQPMLRNWERLGIKGRIRSVDTSQYSKRVDDFDFDVIVSSWGQSQSPGNEQRDAWGSEAADRPGSRNLAGIKDPAVDQLIDKVIFAGSRRELEAATRALDRALLWNHFVIPHFHSANFRIAHWDRFGKPATRPRYGIGFPDTWWIDPAKDASVQERQRASGGR